MDLTYNACGQEVSYKIADVIPATDDGKITQELPCWLALSSRFKTISLSLNWKNDFIKLIKKSYFTKKIGLHKKQATGECKMKIHQMNNFNNCFERI